MRYAERTRAWVGGALLLSVFSLGFSASAKAQAVSATGSAEQPAPRVDAGQEAEALRAFNRGARAYEEGNYEAALSAFEEAFRLGGQPEIQYNIAMAADRAGQEEKAVAAYRAYLELLDEPPYEQEARSRINALLYSGVDPESPISVTYRPVEPYEPDELPKRKRAVVGPVIFMALGAAGLGVMAAGLIQDGQCVDRDAAGRCTEEKTLNSVPTIVYGSVGGAFLLSGVLWVGLSGRTNTVFGLGPGTLQVKGRF